MIKQISKNRFALYRELFMIFGYDLHLNICEINDAIIFYHQVELIKTTNDFHHKIATKDLHEKIILIDPFKIKITSNNLALYNMLTTRNVFAYGSKYNFSGELGNSHIVKGIGIRDDILDTDNLRKIEDAIFVLVAGNKRMPLSILKYSTEEWIHDNLIRCLNIIASDKKLRSKRKKKKINLPIGIEVIVTKLGRLRGEKYNWAKKYNLEIGSTYTITQIHSENLVSVTGLEHVAFSKYHFKKIKKNE